MDEFYKYFDYKDGNLYWKIQTSKRTKVGNVAGTHIGNGYKLIKLNNKAYYAHRIIYFMHHGEMPEFIDHIDGNPFNNRIENLRPATKYQNQINQKLKKNNSSGCKNVCWDKQNQKWKVVLKINKKYKFIGRFDSLELADLAAIEARIKYHGEYARHE